jgi:hypothetical protein
VKRLFWVIGSVLAIVSLFWGAASLVDGDEPEVRARLVAQVEPVSGSGYVEMTGYAHPMQELF